MIFIYKNGKEFILIPKCLRCGKSMYDPIKKPFRMFVIKDIQPIRHNWQCSGCNTVTESIEWRPIGVNDCCKSHLLGLKGIRKRKTPWRFVNDNTLIRPYTTICPVCMQSYSWSEQLVLPYE